MDRNENGMPMPGNIPNGNGGMGNGNGINPGCGGGGCLMDKPLAYVYAPDQAFRMLYSANEALHHGTLFEELYKPKEVYSNE